MRANHMILLERVKKEDVDTVNYDRNCVDCNAHILLAQKLDLDLVYISPLHHFVGVCIKEQKGKGDD